MRSLSLYWGSWGWTTRRRQNQWSPSARQNWRKSLKRGLESGETGRTKKGGPKHQGNPGRNVTWEELRRFPTWTPLPPLHCTEDEGKARIYLAESSQLKHIAKAWILCLGLHYKLRYLDKILIKGDLDNLCLQETVLERVLDVSILNEFKTNMQIRI